VSKEAPEIGDLVHVHLLSASPRQIPSHETLSGTLVGVTDLNMVITGMRDYDRYTSIAIPIAAIAFVSWSWVR
jgi:hypothetical protein